MFARNLPINNSITLINHNDQLIRFIFNHDYDFTVGKVVELAFQIPHLEKGLSVSISRLLDSQTRRLVIKSMEKPNSKYVKDCLSELWKVDSILHPAMQYTVFEVKLTPVVAIPPNKVANPAHAEISFSASMQSLQRSEKKQFRKELMKQFSV